MDESGARGGTGEDGVAAVLYGMFTSFTEALDGFDRRLAAIEAALQEGPVEVVRRLGRLEDAVAAAGRAGATGGTAAIEASLADVAEAQRRRAEVLDQQASALSAALDEVRALLAAHVDDTAHSLSRRAGEAGRRLVGDLGRRGRSRPGEGPPAS